MSLSHIHAHQRAGGQRLACLFYQLDPKKFRSFGRACSGPGFKNINRLLEHIDRCHAPPKFSCNRCGVDCQSLPRLHDHQRSENGCVVRPAAAAEDGLIGAETVDALRHLLKEMSSSTDEEKWTALFFSVFPALDKSTPVSPYYDSSPISGASTPRPCIGSTETKKPCRLNAYAEYLRSQLVDLEGYGSKLCLALGITGVINPIFMARVFRDFMLRDLEAFCTRGSVLGDASISTGACLANSPSYGGPNIGAHGESTALNTTPTRAIIQPSGLGWPPAQGMAGLEVSFANYGAALAPPSTASGSNYCPPLSFDMPSLTGGLDYTCLGFGSAVVEGGVGFGGSWVHPWTWGATQPEM